MATEVKIPERAVFKATEVCSIAGVQPYVLRSWESEFPGLGVVPKGGRTRVYRRADLEQVLRIKSLILDEGLTLGAARRKLQPETAGDDADPSESLQQLLGSDVRQRVEGVKAGLRELLALLGDGGNGSRGAAPASPPPARPAGAGRRAPKK